MIMDFVIVGEWETYHWENIHRIDFFNEMQCSLLTQQNTMIQSWSVIMLPFPYQLTPKHIWNLQQVGASVHNF